MKCSYFRFAALRICSSGLPGSRLAVLQRYPSVFVLTNLDKKRPGGQGMVASGHFRKGFGTFTNSHGALVHHAIAVRGARDQAGVLEHIGEPLGSAVGS